MGPSTTKTLSSAREQLRALYDKQRAALASFFGTQTKFDESRAALATVEADQGAAASLAGVSIAAVKEAAAMIGVASTTSALGEPVPVGRRAAGSMNTGTGALLATGNDQSGIGVLATSRNLDDDRSAINGWETHGARRPAGSNG